ncbi:MAG: chemotaxis protein CheW [Symploca sp. SIO2G7]|nr:chemotaxis protein CheW [Symploca sp. SIO2G7]
MYDKSNVGKFIVFKIADYFLALPIQDVLKVLNCPSEVRGDLRTMGLVQMGRHLIRVWDWHQELAHLSSPQSPPINSNVSQLVPTGVLPKPPVKQTFLVITRDYQGELCGIAVDEPPNLVELPLELMQILPQSQHHSSVFEMVSHVAVLSSEALATTIFILDVERFGRRAINDSQQLFLKPS